MDVGTVIDEHGYRLNVGIILANDTGQVFLGRRLGQDSWQFPQGGIKAEESPQQALFRELEEEVGLVPEDVELLGQTQRWLHYDLPKRYIRRHQTPVCIGQKQIWFLLRLKSADHKVRFDTTDKPEFDGFRWVSYWTPIDEVIFFKRSVYRRALKEFAAYI